MIPGSGRSTGEGIGYPLQYSWVAPVFWRIQENTPVFPVGSAGKESTCKVRDLGLIPGLGRSPGERNGYPLQYSDLENSMDCIVHGVVKSQTQLSNFHFSLPIGKLSNNTIENTVMIEELSILEE